MEKRRTIIQAVVCVVLVCMIWGGYFIARGRIDRQIQPYKDDFSWVYQVDEIYMDKDEIALEGFAFELGKDAKKGAFEIVLQDTETKEFFFPKTQWVRRDDVNSYFLCEYDYSDSGFVASIKADKLLLPEHEYEILLRLENSRGAYCTDTFISEGKLACVKSGNRLPLEVKDTELEQIVNNGMLRLLSPELGFYAYQYNGSMYCIMEEKYKQQEEYLNRVVMSLRTTQINQLPKARLELGATGDEINTYFDDESKIGQYYVCKIDLPTTYSITKIDIGNYNNGWVWRETLRPYYEFE